MRRLKEAMGAAAAEINAALDGYIPRSQDSDGRLFDAMRYSTLAGGKRLRPFLVLQSAALFAVPPDWVGNHKTHPTQDTPDDRPLETGMVFNLENQFDVWEDWPGGSGAAYIETFLMTDSGLEVLSKLPRNLVVV